MAGEMDKEILFLVAGGMSTGTRFEMLIPLNYKFV